MAGRANGRILVSRLCCLAMYAFRDVLRFRCVAFSAFSGLQLGRRSHFVDVPVTRGACVHTQNRVNAFPSVPDFVCVARFTLHSSLFRRMRKILDGGMAIGAGKRAMDARSMLVRANGNALALPGFHVGLAVTGEAGFILIERLGRLFLAPS